MAIRSLGNSSVRYNAVMSKTGLNAAAPWGEPPILQWYGSRGIFVGGKDPGFSNIMDYVTIASGSNAQDFGDITTGTSNCAGLSGTLSAARGVFKGDSPSPGNGQMEYVTVATTGNSTVFGNLDANRNQIGATSNGTRGLFAGGNNPGTNVMQYITIESTGNASDFGDLTNTRYGTSGVGNGTRGVFGGGNTGNPSNNELNVIDYVTISSTGNASDFGDLTNNTFRCAAVTGGDRGVWIGGGGPSASNVMQYIDITSTGNAQDFGDLDRADENGPGGCSNDTRGLIAGGNSGGLIDYIRYITIANTGNTSSFGDLTDARSNLGGTSIAGGVL